MNKLLIIEDDFRVRSQLERGCVEEGFDVTAVGSGREGEVLLHNGSYDVVILDWRLPDKNGVEICRDLRRAGFTIPVLMLTAMETVANRVEGLNAGADDYLTKPFSFDELLARVRALQRRAEISNKKETTLLTYGELQLNPRQHTFMVNKQSVTLTKKEFQLAEFFLQHPEEVLSRQEIAHAVWQLYFDTNTNFIDVYVTHLRQKIAQGTATEYLQGVRGIGYVMRRVES